MEQELPTLPEHPSSPPVFSGVRVTRSLVLCVCCGIRVTRSLVLCVCCGIRVTRSLVLCVRLVNRRFSFCPFSFGHCVVCSSIYGF